jgi:hypothetical protein
VRMPGGVRRKDGGAAVKQKVVYWDSHCGVHHGT